MATMVVEVYDALRSIGIAEDKAAKAAEAMATLEPQFATIRGEMQQGFADMRAEYRGEFAAMRGEMQQGFADMRAEYRGEFAAMRGEMQQGFAATRAEYRGEFAAMRAEYRGEFAAVRSDMRLLKWQVGVLFAITGPTLLLLLRVAAKVGAFG